MDPLKALQDLDKIIAGAPMDRNGHAHVLKCVQSIQEALMKPFSEPVVEIVASPPIPEL